MQMVGPWQRVVLTLRKQRQSSLIVSQWMKENKLKLNATKTHFLLVGTKEWLKVTRQPVVVMDGVHLEEKADKWLI